MSALPDKVSESTVRRLSLYCRALEELEAEGTETVPSRALAERAGTTAAQVRKDLSLFGSFGKRGLGYAVPPLARRLRRILGLDRTWRVGLIGVGRLGAALFAYPHFRERGFQIVAAFDSDPEKVGREWNGVTIRDASALEDGLRSEEVEIAIVAVPAGGARDVARSIAAAGVRGVLNFAPVRLPVPEGVVVNDVNMAVELESLSFALRTGIERTIEEDE